MSAVAQPRGRLGWAAAFAACVVLAVPAQAQTNFLQRCQRSVFSGSVERELDASGEFITYIRDGFDFRCPVEGRRLRSDSAHHFGTQQRLELFGNVVYTEGGTRITADRMTYFRTSDHVDARGNIVARLESGSVISGPSMVYFAKQPPARPEENFETRGRSRFLLVDADSGSGSTDTTIVDADRVLMLGPQIFASGNVVIERTDLSARSDSLFGNRSPENRSLRLMRSPELRSRGTTAFTLTGQLIDIVAGADREIQSVRSTSDARVESDELDVAADTIDLVMENGAISRALAFGDSGATMSSPQYSLRGNALDILMPGQKPSEIRSNGDAYAEFAPDTATIRSTDRNFMKGDTIVVGFEDVIRRRRPAARAPGDTTPPVIPVPVDTTAVDTTQVPRSMLADGHASVFFQRPGSGADKTCPDIHYATGHRIVAVLRGGEVQTMDVKGSAESPLASGANSQCGTGGSGIGGPPRTIPPRTTPTSAGPASAGLGAVSASGSAARIPPE
jgi:lipopolysaccharide export system protein LptA